MAFALIGADQPAPDPTADRPYEEATTEAPAADAYEYAAAEAAADAAAAGAEAMGAEAVPEAFAEEGADAYSTAEQNWGIGRTFWTGQDWEVTENKHDCTLTNRSVSVLYDARLKVIELSFVDASIKSLKRGDTKPIRLSWLTENEGYYGETIRMAARPMPDDNPRVTLMKGRVSGKDFLDNFARMKVIGFGTTKGVVINAWQLDGSAAGIAQLRRCAERVSYVRPSDPFAE